MGTSRMKGNTSTDLKYLIYFSKPAGFDYKTRKNILASSRVNNDKAGLTGSLIYRSDLYLQYLEGPPTAVHDTYKKIKLDSRHSEIHKIQEGMTNQRLFASWAMREDTVRSWMWTREEVKNDLLKNIKPNEALNIFKRLSRGVKEYIHTGEQK